jgi:hypothetical protein
MLNNFKLYALFALFVAALVCCAVQRLQLVNIRSRLETCTAERQAAQVIYVQQLNDLKEKQHAAVQSRVAIERNMQTLMQVPIDPGCEKAIQYGRNYAPHFKSQI